MISYNVNPGLMNPKRLLNWGGTIYVPSKVTIWRLSPNSHKPCFFAKSGVAITTLHDSTTRGLKAPQWVWPHRGLAILLSPKEPLPSATRWMTR